MIDVTKPLCHQLQIGYQGENEARSFQFDFSGWTEQYGNGLFSLVARQPNSDTSYPVDIDVDGTTATWTVSDSDLAVIGYGEIEAWYEVNDVRVASAIYGTYNSRSLDGEGPIPTPYESWLQTVIDTKDEAVQAKDTAVEAADNALNVLKNNLLFDDDGIGNITISIKESE